MRRLTRHLDVESSSGGNDCGPCATAMALSYLLGRRIKRQEAAAGLRFWRIPWIGATLPHGVVQTLQKHGFATSSGWFGTLRDIKAHIDADHPVIVLVRPTDIPRAPFFSLHYRVVVGYNDSAKNDHINESGGGELYFNCSAYPPKSTATTDERPGNLTIPYALFRRQWVTWAAVNWYAAAYPGKAGLG